MNRRSFITISVLTVAVTVAAGVSIYLNRTGDQDQALGKAFPNLINRVNDIQKVVLRQGETTLTLARAGAGWSLEERNGYPVRADRVRAAVLGLAQLELLEQKTRQPERYKALDLGDPEADDARSRRFTLLDKDGGEIAKIVIGKQKLTVGNTSGVYLRKPGDPQTWLAKGKFNPGTLPYEWLVKEIVDIPFARVSSLVLSHPDGETLTASRASVEVEHLSLEGLADGAKLKSPSAPDDLASPFARLELEDVRKAGEITFDPLKTVRLTIRTFDGLTLEAALFEAADDYNWLTLVARGEEQEAPTKTSDTPEPKADAGSQTLMEKKGPIARAWAINDRVAGWVFSIPAYKAGAFATRLKDLLEEKKEEDTKPGEK